MNYRNYLTEEILPFWQKNAIDWEYGGILHQLDKHGNVMETDKNVWFIGRAMWSYAHAYNTIEQRPEYLETCEQLFRFFEKCERPGGKLPFVVARDGTLKTERESYYNSEAYAAMGLAQYYKACGKEEVWQKAEQYFDILFAMYKENAASRQTLNTPVPTKAFGLHMSMLVTAQFIRNVGRDAAKFDTLACMAVNEMMHGGYVDDDRRTVMEYIDFHGNQINDHFAMHFCPGQIYEAAWFVFCEGEIKNDDTIRAFGKKLCDYAMPQGFEEKCKLIPTSCHIDTSPYGDPDDICLWWPQCEAVLAYRLAYNIFGDKKYLDQADRIEKTAFECFADVENGEWYFFTDPAGNVLNDSKGSLFKGPFHLPRMLMALISLEETGSILKYMNEG